MSSQLLTPSRLRLSGYGRHCCLLRLIFTVCWPPKGDKNKRFLNDVPTSPLLRAQSAQDSLVFHNIVQKLGNATFRILFYSTMALLSHGVAPPLDRVSLVNGPVWKFASLKGYQKYLMRKGWLPCMEGLPWRQLSIWTSFKTSLANVFPVDCELCFFFHVVLFRRSEVYSINVWGAAEGVAPTLNALHPLFNVRKIAYSPFA